LIKGISKWLASSERKVLRKILGMGVVGIKANENWRQ
jgi:hypothetical protein